MSNNKEINVKIRTVADGVGGEAAIAAMDEYSRAEIGRKTYRFVRRCMRDPELRARIKARAAELAAGSCNSPAIPNNQ